MVKSITDAFSFITPVNGLMSTVFGGLPFEVRTLIITAFSIGTLALFYRVFRGV
jgi:hypothetical protein